MPRYTITSRNGWRKTLTADTASEAVAMTWPGEAMTIRGTVITHTGTLRTVGVVEKEPEPKPEPVCWFGHDSAGRPDGTVHHDTNCPDNPGQITNVLTGAVLRARR